MSVAEIDHICCCDPAVALCGAQVAGTAVSFDLPSAATNMCAACRVANEIGGKCADPECPGPEAEIK